MKASSIQKGANILRVFAVGFAGLVLLLVLSAATRGQGDAVLWSLGTGWWGRTGIAITSCGLGVGTVLGLIVLLGAGVWGLRRRAAAAPGSTIWRTLRFGTLVVTLAGVGVSLSQVWRHARLLAHDELVEETSWSSAEPFGHPGLGRNKEICDALRAYAQAHSGEFPKTLNELVERGFFEIPEYPLPVAFRDDLPVPWIVLPGSVAQAPMDLPLVVSSQPVIGEFYIMGFRSGRVHFVTPEEHHRALARWRRQMGSEAGSAWSLP